MLDIMLCGASDTVKIRDDFVRTILEFGGNPLHFLSGNILHINAMSSSWVSNSRVTVRTADLCIFVVLRSAGQITWQTEFHEVVTSGKPFLILALADTYQQYLELSQAVPDDRSEQLSHEQRRLFETLASIEQQFQATIVPFESDGFALVLRRQLAGLFVIGLHGIEIQNRRQFIRMLFHQPDDLSPQQLEWTTELALDESEDKTARKQALLALARHDGLPRDTVLALLASGEQGVQRQAFHLLPQLYPERPPDEDFLRDVIDIANDSDDVGLSRRLVPTLFDMDLESALKSLDALNLNDIGLRRRIAERIEANEQFITSRGLVPLALALATKCQLGDAARDWKARLRAFIERHTEPMPT